MGNLKDVAIKYIESEDKYGDEKALYHFNCAEVILYSCNDYYNLGLDKKALRAITPFGGGFYSEKACGALTGGIAVLGVMFTEDKPTNNENLKEMTKKWVKLFEEEFGNLDCKEIKLIHREEVKGCGPVIARAAELFESIIKE